MAGETTLTPVAADISPTAIAGVKERSTRWIAALAAAPDGFTLADINHRQRVAISLLQLSVDHHVSLRLLIDAEMLPSARALYRPQIEAYLRGLWAHLCASEAQLERFLQSGALPRLDDMLAALEALDHELWSPRWDRSGSCAGRRAPHAPTAEDVSQHLRGRRGRVNDTIESSPAVPQKTKTRS